MKNYQQYTVYIVNQTETGKMSHMLLLITYISRYWSKAVLASTSSFLSLSEGTAPSSNGGS